MRRWNEFRIPAIRITGLPLTAMLAAVLLPCGACQRRPLSQVDNNVTVNIEIEHTPEENRRIIRIRR